MFQEREDKQKASFIDQLAEVLHKNDCESYAFSDLSTGIGRAIENVKMNNKLSISSDLLSLAIAPSSTTNLLDESKPDLLGKIFSGLLFEDRLLSFMNIRKGKVGCIIYYRSTFISRELYILTCCALCKYVCSEICF